MNNPVDQILSNETTLVIDVYGVKTYSGLMYRCEASAYATRYQVMFIKLDQEFYFGSAGAVEKDGYLVLSSNGQFMMIQDVGFLMWTYVMEKLKLKSETDARVYTEIIALFTKRPYSID